MRACNGHHVDTLGEEMENSSGGSELRSLESVECSLMRLAWLINLESFARTACD
jgi:hypothetical protein